MSGAFALLVCVNVRNAKTVVFWPATLLWHASGALSWNQLKTVATTLKTAASGNLLLVTDAAELMLKLGSTANPALPYPWQARPLALSWPATEHILPYAASFFCFAHCQVVNGCMLRPVL